VEFLSIELSFLGHTSSITCEFTASSQSGVLLIGQYHEDRSGYIRNDPRNLIPILEFCCGVIRVSAIERALGFRDFARNTRTPERVHRHTSLN
jgi:hypothetical protein